MDEAGWPIQQPKSPMRWTWALESYQCLGEGEEAERHGYIHLVLHEKFIVIPAMGKGEFQLRIRVLDAMVKEIYTSNSLISDDFIAVNLMKFYNATHCPFYRKKT